MVSPKGKGKRNGSGPNGRKAQPPLRTRDSTPWLLLLPVVFVLPWILCKLHYSLPSPQPPVYVECA